MWLRCPKPRIRLSTEKWAGKSSSKQRHREYGGSLRFLIVSPMIVLQITAFVAVGAVLVVAAWIGWTMATTPPPAPLEAEPTASLPVEKTETVGQ
jgi:predicted DNA-binding transcriptional regulator